MPPLAGHPYETQMASDLVRDGMALELLDASGEVVADVFYSDATGEMILSAYRHHLPLEVVKCLIASAKQRLPPRADRAERVSAGPTPRGCRANAFRLHGERRAIFEAAHTAPPALPRRDEEETSHGILENGRIALYRRWRPRAVRL